MESNDLEFHTVWRMPLDFDRWTLVVEMLQAVLIVVVAFQVRLLTKNAAAIQFDVQLMSRSQMLDEFFKCEQTTAGITFSAAEPLQDERNEVHAPSGSVLPSRCTWSMIEQ